MKTRFTFLLFISLIRLSVAQVDSMKTKELNELVIKSYKVNVDWMPATQGTFMLGGNKNEVIHIGNMNINVTEKIPRQIFAKVPGVFVYDMDGTGNQTNISTRGLDPHRGWEFNIRENGVITNSDMYGYPASYLVCRWKRLNELN